MIATSTPLARTVHGIGELTFGTARNAAGKHFGCVTFLPLGIQGARTHRTKLHTSADDAFRAARMLMERLYQHPDPDAAP